LRYKIPQARVGDHIFKPIFEQYADDFPNPADILYGSGKLHGGIGFEFSNFVWNEGL